MDARLGEDMDRYRVALTKTGGAVGDIEPISRFHEVFQGPVDAAYAAAVVGLETEAFQEKIRENIGLQNIGLLVLDSENGSMKRDTWTSSFPDILFALNFPKLVDKPRGCRNRTGYRVPLFISLTQTSVPQLQRHLVKAPNALLLWKRWRDWEGSTRGTGASKI